jgi:hypothetical protein
VQVQGNDPQSPARTQRPLRPYVASLCLVFLLQSVNLALFGPLGRQDPAPVVEASTTSIPYTNVNPYGANTFLSKEVESWKREKTVAMMADAGLGWMKQQFPWSEIEPKQGRFWDDKYNQNSWDKYDRIVDLAEKNGIRVIARLDNTPDWARGPNTTPQTPPGDPDRFADFVVAFINHYKGRVQYLQIWNEPNLKAEWGGSLDAAAYATMLQKVYTKAKAADPTVVILSAPLAQTLEQGDRGLNDLVFLQQLYDAGFGKSFDILMANGYGFDQPPDAAPDPQVLNLRRVELLRAIMERNGDADKPVWLNEYAWNASPPDLPASEVPWKRVTEEQQASYTIAGIRYMREHWPWLGVVNIWYFRQVGDIPDTKGEFYFRMVDPEFTPRLLYNEVAKATAPQRLALPGRYSPLSAALLTKGRWSTTPTTGDQPVAIQSMSQGDIIDIHFQGNMLALEGFRSPQGGRLGVLVDGSTEAVQDLPKDDKGRPYLDFRGTGSDPTMMTVVAGLDSFGTPSAHRVQLTTLPRSDGTAGTVEITAMEVAYTRSPLVFLIISACAALLTLGMLARVVGHFTRRRRLRVPV